MLRNLVIGAAIAAVTFAGTTAVQASNDMPGKGVTVQPARATWNTGFFQEALVRKGLETLGFDVKKPKDLQNPIFYKSLTLGDVDYWANGWFPLHVSQLPKDFDEKAAATGNIIKAGGLQGYLVSKKHVEEYNIKSLDDYKRDEVKKAFDKNRDGKADLTACPPGWGCETVISHHMEVYELDDHINANKASYEAGMASTLAAYKNDEPIFFYTWAPNWTIHKLKPGSDVMWINVPEIKPNESQKPDVELMTVSGIEGAVSDPVELGFVVNDIRIVANNIFLEKNPAAKAFFEAVKVSLSDVNKQNTLMNDGEKSQKDIERHVAEWIASNQDTWNSWLDAARKAAM